MDDDNYIDDDDDDDDDNDKVMMIMIYVVMMLMMMMTMMMMMFMVVMMRLSINRTRAELKKLSYEEQNNLVLEVTDLGREVLAGRGYQVDHSILH